jgi:hypothetical protein
MARATLEWVEWRIKMAQIRMTFSMMMINLRVSKKLE